MSTIPAFLPRALVRGLALLLLPAGFLGAQSAGTGTIAGRVAHGAAGAFLNNVRLAVDGTAIEAFSNESGEYRLVNVPAGEVTVRAAAAGRGTQSVRVRVEAGQTVQRDFDLGASTAATGPGVPRGDAAVVMAAFTVAERELNAQSSALQEQRTAPNIKNVVAFEEFGDLGEGNPGEFLKFVPGIQVAMSPAIPSNATIRGMPGSGTVLTVDGIELASDSPGARGAGFTSSNTANIDRIEVTKVPTPDMPANAVGGMINIVSKSGFSRRSALFTFNAFGTLTTLQPITQLGRELFATGGPDGPTHGRHTRPGFDFTYIKPIHRTLSVSLSGGHNVRWEDKDSLAPTWNRVTLVQTGSGINAQVAARHRNVAATRVDWKPWPGHTVYGSIQFTNDDVYSRQHAFNQAYGTGATGGPNFTQGAATGVGTITQALTYREQLKNTTLYTAGYKFEGHRWNFDTRVAFSEARRRTLSAVDEHPFFGTVNATIPNLVLRAEGFSGQALGTPPKITAVNRAGQPVDVTDGRLYTLNTVTSPQEPLMTHQLTHFKANVSREFGREIRLRVMAGGDVANNVRDLAVATQSWSFRPLGTAAERLVGSYDLINEEYSAQRAFPNGDRVRWVHPAKVYQLFKAQPSWFVLNEAAAHTSRVNGSERLEETVSAGFLRGDLKLFDNRLWLVGGARYERTADEGLGGLNDIRATYQQDASGNLLRDAAGRPMRVAGDALALARLQYRERAARAEKSYGDYYPSLNASYSVTENLMARAAFARTIGRPNLEFIIPSRSVTDPAAAESTRVITTTNTGLQPWTADNYDLSLETYSLKGATVSVSLFRKEISNFFVSTRTDATLALLSEMGLSDDYLDYDVVTTTNSNEPVRLSGLEWSWRQSIKDFAFVPTWARGFQVWVNGTHLRLSGAGQDNFSGYAPRVINGGVSYANARFLAKLNLSRIGRTRAALDAVSASVPAGTYQAQEVRTVLDANVEYRITRRMALYTSVRNLANEPRPLITYSPNAPAYTLPRSYTYYGALWTFGVKGTF
jgi:TonB-dependent receptor